MNGEITQQNLYLLLPGKINSIANCLIKYCYPFLER